MVASPWHKQEKQIELHVLFNLMKTFDWRNFHCMFPWILKFCRITWFAEMRCKLKHLCLPWKRQPHHAPINDTVSCVYTAKFLGESRLLRILHKDDKSKSYSAKLAEKAVPRNESTKNQAWSHVLPEAHFVAQGNVVKRIFISHNQCRYSID